MIADKAENSRSGDRFRTSAKRRPCPIAGAGAFIFDDIVGLQFEGLDLGQRQGLEILGDRLERWALDANENVAFAVFAGPGLEETSRTGCNSGISEAAEPLGRPGQRAFQLL